MTGGSQAPLTTSTSACLASASSVPWFVGGAALLAVGMYGVAETLAGHPSYYYNTQELVWGVTGLGKYKGRLIILLDISKVLGAREMGNEASAVRPADKLSASGSGKAGTGIGIGTGTKSASAGK